MALVATRRTSVDRSPPSLLVRLERVARFLVAGVQLQLPTEPLARALRLAELLVGPPDSERQPRLDPGEPALGRELRQRPPRLAPCQREEPQAPVRFVAPWVDGQGQLEVATRVTKAALEQGDVGEHAVVLGALLRAAHRALQLGLEPGTIAGIGHRVALELGHPLRPTREQRIRITGGD